jgi:hypothetical protein
MAAAQQNSDTPSDSPFEIERDEYVYELYARGDQTFVISLGTVFPAVFFHEGKVLDLDFRPPVGGSGSLMYNYYFGSRFFLGGELSGLFIHSINHTLFIVPLGLRVGTQFIAGRFEFPLAFTLGMCWHTYLDASYYGLYMKGGASVYYRATHEWSFGLSTDWGWFPQWVVGEDKNTVYGNFIYLMLSARYHF